MPQYLVAIDLSQDSARIAIGQASLRQAALVDVKSIALDPTQTLEDQLAKVRQTLPPQVGSVIVNAQAKATSSRRIEFPFTDARKIETALQFELEDQLPYAIEDLATAWTVSGRAGNTTTVLVAMTPRQPLLDVIDRMARQTFEPRAMIMPAASLAELLPVDHKEAGPIAIAALGASECHVVVYQQGIQLARTLRVGGVDIDRALTRFTNNNLEEARKLKETRAQILGKDDTATPEEQEISRAVLEGLLPLLRELSITFRALPPLEQPAKLYLTGGLSRLPGLCQFLQRKFNIPVELVDLSLALGTVEYSGAPVPPENAMAVGMLLCLLRKGGNVPLNFRRGQMTYKGDIQVYRGQLLRLALGMTAVFLLSIISSIISYASLSSTEKQVTQKFCEATKKVIGKEVCDPTAALAILKQSQGTSDGPTIPTHSAATLFEMLSKGLGTDIDAVFDSLEFRIASRSNEVDRITGKGETDSFDTADKISARLKTDPCVKTAEVSNQRKGRNNNRVEFQLLVEVKCPPKTLPGQSFVSAAGALQ